MTDGAPQVVGMSGGPLTAAAAAGLQAADVVIGAARHLAAAQIPDGATRVELGDLSVAARLLGEAGAGGVLLASGDPGFFGAVRYLQAAGLRAEVHPAVSSVALAFARAGLAWDDALVVSAHGRDLRRAANVCRAHRKVAVLTGPSAGPAELGAALVGVGRRLFVAADLGGPDEQVCWVAPEEAAARAWPALCVVLSIRPDRGEPDPGPGWLAGWAGPHRWALPDDEFEHRAGMVTKAEVRAVALAALGPGPGDLVWDLGTGSGSVAVECARLGAAVVAVERDGTALAAANAARHGVDVALVHGTAPAALVGLPVPDAVFVGGGGDAVGDIVAACVAHQPRVVVVALAATERLPVVRAALGPYIVEGVQVSAARLRPLGAVHGLAAENPVLLVTGRRP